MNIGKVYLDLKTYDPKNDIYSDGNIENEILEIVKEGREEEILKKDDRWPILYHLSEVRKNILSWYPFEKDKSILEIGCGCGAITNLFCEKNLSITAVESSKRRAIITAIRNKNYSKLKIDVGDFNLIEYNQKYDYITLIGVLEYAPMFCKSNNPFKDLLTKCRNLLKDSGYLFIAIENRLGIKYWAGATEDHTGKLFDGIEGYSLDSEVKTFSKNELRALVMEMDFKDIEWYYPYPDYKLPIQIFSDKFLPTGEFLYPDICSFDKNRFSFFNEKKVIQNLADCNEFKNFSNSFLLICKGE